MIYGTYIKESYTPEQIPVKKNESKIRSFINKTVKEFYKEEINNKKNDPNYDWREHISKAPYVDKFDYNSSDYTFIDLKYASNDTRDIHDYIIFFESDFCRWLRHYKHEMTEKFVFEVEDYPGIYVYARSNSLNEAKIIDKQGSYSANILTDKKLAGLNIGLFSHNCNSDKDKENQLSNLDKDFNVVKKEYKKYIKDKFLAWIGEGITEKDIKLYEITYSYKHIVSKYSPTNKDDFFGEFEFCFNPTNAKAKKIFDAASLNLLVNNNKIVKATCNDI